MAKEQYVMKRFEERGTQCELSQNIPNTEPGLTLCKEPTMPALLEQLNAAHDAHSKLQLTLQHQTVTYETSVNDLNHTIEILQHEQEQLRTEHGQLQAEYNQLQAEHDLWIDGMVRCTALSIGWFVAGYFVLLATPNYS